MATGSAGAMAIGFPQALQNEALSGLDPPQ
jgi:hypothetical protein